MDGFERFVGDAVEATRREFSVGRALRGTGFGPGGEVLDRLRKNADALERRVVEPELREYRRRSVEQFDVVLRAVESDEPFASFADELLAADSYLDSLDPEASAATRESVEEAVLTRLERLGEGVEPIVAHASDEFWVAVRESFDREAAHELVEDAFPFTGPLRRHRDAFAFTVAVDPGEILGSPLARGLPTVSVDYTDEAVRAMRRAEKQVVHDTKAAVDERFDE